MPMIHLPEISAKNWYQKTVMVSHVSDKQVGTEFFCYQFLVTNWTWSIFVPVIMVHVSIFLIRVFGADFWYVCHGHYVQAAFAGSR